MKILLAWRICVVGGLETWMAGLAQAFQSLGHECELFFFAHGPFAEFIPAGVKAHFGNLESLVRLVHDEKFDVVQCAAIDWEYGISAVRRVGAKLVINGNGWVQPLWNSTNCDAIVGCAGWNARAQEALSDMPAHVVRNGIHLDRFPMYKGEVKGAPIVAWIGRGAALDQKQIDRLAAVAPLLVKGGARVWVADPDGPEKVPANLAAMLKPAAEKWGRIPPAEMVQFYHDVAASGGCILSTSAYEGLSLAYVEGQACGCPIIGPDVVGVNESFDTALGGMVYPPEMKAEELASLVLSTLDDKEKMAWRRAGARKFVEENCTFEKTAKEYLEVYAGAPYSRRRSMKAMMARRSHSPILHWRDYVEHRWGVGRQCYELSEQFMKEGMPELARAMLKESLVVAPTIFARGRRIRHGFNVMRRASQARQG